MHALAIKIDTLSPVLLTSNSGDSNMTGSLDHLTGSSLLGLFAHRYIRKKNLSQAHQDETFYRWFLKGELTFFGAYLVLEQDQQEITLLPTPLAIQTDKAGSKIYNIARYDMGGLRMPTKATGGYCAIDGGSILKDIPRLEMNMHHFRKDRLKGHSEDGGIFNYEALSARQSFKGIIFGQEQDLLAFKSLMGSRFESRLGRSRNTQYGQVQVDLQDISEVVPQLPREDEIILTFISPAILLNQYGFPEASIGVLKRYLDNLFGEVPFEINLAIARIEGVETFVSVWKHKRPLDRALSSGTTVKLKFPGGIPQSAQEKIRELSMAGLGERRHEGFGRVLVNWIMEEVYTLKPKELKTSPKPAGDIPESVKFIFSSVILDNFFHELEMMARADAREFFKYSKQQLSSNFLGRLELMLREAGDAEAFIRMLSSLKPTAKGKIEAVRDTKETLWQVLVGKKRPDFNKLLSNLPSACMKLSLESGLQFPNAQVLQNQMYRHYWLNLFRTMRKLNKTGDRHE